ncbi:MAG: hypothetical protein HYZ34_00375 [Ignavibacteriae bacterium]|nr:hypothetical protein [Ignavibacteriota bacterium]
MIETLRELYEHQAWADAELWRAVVAHPQALEDTLIRERFYHYHLAQDAFLLIVQKKQLIFKPLEDYKTMNDLYEYAKGNHIFALQFIQDITEEFLAERVFIPWFKEPRLIITKGQSLLQAVMHSQYHRGQNASRLKDLGGKPPLLDYIAWLQQERPQAPWL